MISFRNWLVLGSISFSCLWACSDDTGSVMVDGGHASSATTGAGSTTTTAAGAGGGAGTSSATGSGTGGSVGSGGAGGGGGSFADVQAIFDRRCVACHDATLPRIKPETGCCFPDLPLTADVSYARIVGKLASETCGGTLITPGNPETSYLYHKVNDDQPCYGNRMPAYGQIRTPPLTAGEIATIADWIRAGAPR